MHRIGRTGRAEAIGDAISFVTPDDESSVRDLEKMTRKRVERKTAKDFDYTERAAPAAFYPSRPTARPATRPQFRERRRA